MDYSSISCRYINCPICSSNKHVKAYRNVHYYWNKRSKVRWVNQLVVCRDCGMVYTNPQPLARELAAYYRNYLMYGQHSQRYALSQIEFIRKNIPQGCKSVFDIGAFNGVFLNLMSKHGFRVSGIEPSSSAVKYARKAYGLQLERGVFNSVFAGNYARKFDLVTIRNVLEHVGDPCAFLKDAAKLVKPNGYIFLEVPDTEHPFIDNVADFFSMEHIMSFTRDTLVNISKLLQFKLVAIRLPKSHRVIQLLWQVLLREPARKRVFINNSGKNIALLKDYTRKRKAYIQKIRAKLARFKNKQIIIYGAGQHTMQLFAEDILSGFNIEKVVDSDPLKWGRTFENSRVMPPKVLSTADNPVLISSKDNQEDISRFLQNKFPHLEQIKLYG